MTVEKPNLTVKIGYVGGSIKMFLGTLYAEDGETIIHEATGQYKEFVIRDLRPWAQEYIKLYMEHHADTSNQTESD